MNRASLFVIALLASPLAQAETVPTVADETCVQAGRGFGQATARVTPVINQCYLSANIAVKTNHRLFARKADGSLGVLGFQNIIYLLRGKQMSIISGEMSGLGEILAVALSPDGSTVAVLNKYYDEARTPKKIFCSFPPLITGMWCPLVSIPTPR